MAEVAVRSGQSGPGPTRLLEDPGAFPDAPVYALLISRS